MHCMQWTSLCFSLLEQSSSYIPFVNVHAHTYVYTCTYVYIHACTCTMYMHACVHMFTYMVHMYSMYTYTYNVYIKHTAVHVYTHVDCMTLCILFHQITNYTNDMCMFHVHVYVNIVRIVYRPSSRSWGTEIHKVQHNYTYTHTCMYWAEELLQLQSCSEFLLPAMRGHLEGLPHPLHIEIDTTLLAAADQDWARTSV